MHCLKLSSPDFPYLAEAGSVSVFTGKVLNLTLKVTVDGNGIPLETPRTIHITIEISGQDVVYDSEIKKSRS